MLRTIIYSVAIKIHQSNVVDLCRKQGPQGRSAQSFIGNLSIIALIILRRGKLCLYLQCFHFGFPFFNFVRLNSAFSRNRSNIRVFDKFSLYMRIFKHLWSFSFQATDRDQQNTNNSEFTFEIISSTDEGLKNNLTLNETSGEIKLNTTLDYESLTNPNGTVKITVEVKDKGTPTLNSTCVVEISIQVR